MRVLRSLTLAAVAAVLVLGAVSFTDLGSADTASAWGPPKGEGILVENEWTMVGYGQIGALFCFTHATTVVVYSGTGDRYVLYKTECW